MSFSTRLRSPPVALAFACALAPTFCLPCEAFEAARYSDRDQGRPAFEYFCSKVRSKAFVVLVSPRDSSSTVLFAENPGQVSRIMEGIFSYVYFRWIDDTHARILFCGLAAPEGLPSRVSSVWLTYDFCSIKEVGSVRLIICLDIPRVDSAQGGVP